MHNNILKLVETYCASIAAKNTTKIEQYLHPDIQFIGPLVEIKGKKQYLEALKGFMNAFNTFTIRTKFVSDNQAMIIYDVCFPELIEKTRTAALLTFQETRIIRIELFFDARPFDKK